MRWRWVASGGAAVRDVSGRSLRLFDEHSENLKGAGGDRSGKLSDGGGSGGMRSTGRARAPAHEAAPAQESCNSDAETQESWRLEPHICRACFSRLVSRGADVASRRYHCTNCGLEAVAPGADALCCCGTKIRRPTKGAKSGAALVDAGLRCAVNPAPSPEFPSVIIAMEVPNSG